MRARFMVTAVSVVLIVIALTSGVPVAHVVAQGTADTSGFAVGATVVVNDDNVSLRAAPSTDATVVEVLARGTTLVIIAPAQMGGGFQWYPVQNPETGTIGFVRAELLSLPDTPAGMARSISGDGWTGRRFVEGVDAQLDEFGRVPVARLAFEAGAEAPAGYLPSPSMYMVESGAFVFRAGTTETPVEAGGRITISDPSLTIRNTGASSGSLLVLALLRDDAWFSDAAHRCCWNVLAEAWSSVDGVTFQLASLRMQLRETIADVRLTIDQVTIDPGGQIVLEHPMGDDAMEDVAVLVEAGTIVSADDSDSALKPGDDETFETGEAIVNAGTEPAVVLIIWTAESATDT